MIKKIEVAPSTRVRHVGMLDVAEFYRWIQMWLEFNGYWANTNEVQYIETMLPGGSKKIEFNWECRKKRSPDFTYLITLDAIYVGIKDVEIQKEEKKIKIQRGDFDMIFSAKLEKSLPDNFFMELYERFIIRKRIEEYKLDLYGKFYSLIEETREFLNVYV
ncbi:MAG: hypothetical protein QGF74_02125 [Candidatus Nanoarchaeia archaeon]|jgi:hypothetical protein|nr:hypothetical protein [Candidatus Nanoarchaeia archaeon]|tara:strand:- start:60692 stop:61174 length:483 start_codon:yes stop_codon:yes gene_type:complete